MADIPRSAWALVGFSIALFAASAGLGELAKTYEELYDLGRCEGYKSPDGRPNSSLATCKSTRLRAGAAHVGATMAQVPGVGILLVSVAVAVLHNRSERIGNGRRGAKAPPEADEHPNDTPVAGQANIV